jgi:DNA-binding MarR family transcriptional regulator
MVLASFERAAHLIGAYVERAAREHSITQAEAHILVQLARRGALPLAELHREFGTKRSTLTNVLDRLEGRELVRREPNPADRRSFTIRPTRRGAALGRELAALLDDLESEVRRLVPEHDLRSIGAIVDALGTAIGHRER